MAARAVPITRAMKRVLVVLAVILGGLGVTWALGEGRESARQLLLLTAIAMAVFVAGRGFWRWWKSQPEAIASYGLWIAFGLAATGWLTVALVHAVGRIRSDNYILIVVFPLLLVWGAVVVAGGVIGAGLGASVAFSGRTGTHGRRALLVTSGAAAAILNLWHVERVVRLLYTG